MPVRSTMKNRKHFRPMFLTTLAGIALILFVFGVLGCLCFGAEIKDIVFLNFPKTEIFVFCLQMIYGVGCILTFPIYINVAASIIFKIEKFKGCFIENAKAYWYCSSLRIGIILFVYAISMSGLNILD